MNLRRRLLKRLTAAAFVVVLSGAGTVVQDRSAAAENISQADLLIPPPAGDRVLGRVDAPITVVEYASMTCPHCARFHETVFPEFKKRYIESGEVRFIFRDFPLDPLAAVASALARCVDKDSYFPMVETLFHEQRQWMVQRPMPQFVSMAKLAGVGEQPLRACLSDRKIVEDMQAEQKRASEQFGVRSTPTFFVNGEMHAGGISIEDLAKMIEAASSRSVPK